MFTSPWRTWLSASVLSPSAASYVASLERHGYSIPIAGAYLHAVGHFAYWLTEEHLTLRRLDESVVCRFLTTHLPTCRCPGRCQRTVVGVQAALGHLLDVLRADGRIPERRVGLSPAIHDELERFTSHLEQVCGLAAKTRAGHRWWAGQFLADRFGRGPIAVDRLTSKTAVLGNERSVPVRRALTALFRRVSANRSTRIVLIPEPIPFAANLRLVDPVGSTRISRRRSGI